MLDDHEAHFIARQHKAQARGSPGLVSPIGDIAAFCYIDGNRLVQKALRQWLTAEEQQ